VGKTSLAIAAADFAKQSERGNQVEYHDVLWGKFAYADPSDSLKALGEEIAEFLSSYLPSTVHTPTLDFSGSLAPLMKVTAILQRERPKTKFVVILDEFDEIHPELYRQGKLAETFFANLRALSNVENLGFVLVGGENMPFVMDRQGQKLNKFVKEQLDYFSRDKEWDDYAELIRRPAAGTLTWHDDALQSVFHASNGNPYFTKIICASVFEHAVKERDADITAHEVDRAIARELPAFDTNSFAHLWQDGVLASGEKAESEVLRRSRVLVAIARTLRRGESLTDENVRKNKQSTMLQDFEVSLVLNDFCRREILSEKAGVHEFRLPLFRDWLVDVGLNRVGTDTLGDEVAARFQAAEDSAYVQSAEIADVLTKWHIYQGREIGIEQVRAWLNQVESKQDQRLLFKVLGQVRFFSEVEIRSMLKTAHSAVRQYLPPFIQRRRSERRLDVIVTYIDGQGKSGQYYASRYAEENGILTKSIIPPDEFARSARDYETKNEVMVQAVVIVDDIIASGKSISDNLRRFVNKNKLFLGRKNLVVIVVALSSTVEGEAFVREALSDGFPTDIDLRICEPLDPKLQAFHPLNGLWATQEELDRAKALCTQIGSRIYADNPLGFGGMGLLVVFPQTCPNNSLPLLHSSGRGESHPWTPLFPRPVN
jgi:hypothetical protein